MKITTKSQIETRQAGTEADSEQKDEDYSVSPNNAKPHVVRIPFFSVCHLRLGLCRTEKVYRVSIKYFAN